MQWSGLKLNPSTMVQSLNHVFISELVDIDDGNVPIFLALFLQNFCERGRVGLTADIPPELAERLGIVEAMAVGKPQEIDRICLVPISALTIINPSAAGFYAAHLRRTARVLGLAGHPR